jgi:hypothetical protein
MQEGAVLVTAPLKGASCLYPKKHTKTQRWRKLPKDEPRFLAGTSASFTHTPSRSCMRSTG